MCLQPGKTMSQKHLSVFFVLCLITPIKSLLEPRFPIQRKFSQAVNTERNYKTLYHRQPIDHFGYSNQDAFNMRYLVADQYWNHDGGPIFFYCGNEGDIAWFCNNTGAMWDWAPEFKAMLVFAEHRYYGESLPYGKDSYKDISHLGYLSSEQALADFASLLLHLKNTIPGAKNSPIIAFGGSYGGMLATWFRMKYPHVVHGSLAASAPIWMFGDLTSCDSFYRVVTKDFTEAGPNCAENIHKSWPVIDQFGASESGRSFLESTFKLCKPLKSAEDVGNLKGWLYNTYGNLAMVDYPYPASFLEPLPAWPIKEVCSHLDVLNPSNITLLSHIAEATRIYYNYTGSEKCLNVEEQALQDLGAQGWDFQACSEMVMPLCSTGVHDMFEPNPFNMTLFTEGCQKKWSVTPRPQWPLTVYGGKDLSSTSNIIFSNGGLDPWSAYGVLKDLSSTLISILIPEGAHHLDLRAANPQDPESVIKARQQEKSIIQGWIEEYNSQNTDLETFSFVGVFSTSRPGFHKRWVKHAFLAIAAVGGIISILVVLLILGSHRRNRARLLPPKADYTKTTPELSCAEAEKTPLL